MAKIFLGSSAATLFWLVWCSLSHGLSIFQEGNSDKDTLKLEAKAETSKVGFVCLCFCVIYLMQSPI